jgi:hypothetical protein
MFLCGTRFCASRCFRRRRYGGNACMHMVQTYPGHVVFVYTYYVVPHYTNLQPKIRLHPTILLRRRAAPGRHVRTWCILSRD